MYLKNDTMVASKTMFLHVEVSTLDKYLKFA